MAAPHHITTTRCKTQLYRQVINAEAATAAYEYLAKNIQWEEGVRSKHGFTRLAKSLQVGDDEIVDNLLTIALEAAQQYSSCSIVGLYLNYYRDGTHHTPSHSHKGMTQLVISLGCDRVLKVGAKDYTLQNGDVIVFGSSSHSVPVSQTTQGRISIATFMVRE